MRIYDTCIVSVYWSRVSLYGLKTFTQQRAQMKLFSNTLKCVEKVG